METKKTTGLKDFLINFCEYTTIHGLFFVTAVTNRYLQILWGIVVAIGFGLLALHLYSIIVAFLEYKTTEYAHEHSEGYYFPDVTICNLNGISSTNLQDVAQDNPDAKLFLDVSNRTENPNHGPLPRRTDLYWALAGRAYNVGHQFQDFVIRCRFQGQPCKDDDFILFQFPRFFNCYTFKRGRESKSITQGATAALSLTLYIEPQNADIIKMYNDRIIVDDIDGVRVVLTPPNSLAAVGAIGYDILPGHATSIGFDIIEYERLSDPYSMCRGVDSMPLDGNFTYSFTECKNICIHKLVIQKCGCFPTRYVLRNNYTDTNVTSCGQYLFSNKTLNSKLLGCQEDILKIIETLLDYAKDCNCHAPCEDTKYPITTSQSEYPSENSINSFWSVVLEDNPNKDNLKPYQHYHKLLAQNPSLDTLKTWTRKHFLRINVFANSRTVSVRKQIPMITLVDLMAQIGGCLGLWLGISVITVVELMYFCGELGCIFLKMFRRWRQS